MTYNTAGLERSLSVRFESLMLLTPTLSRAWLRGRFTIRIHALHNLVEARRYLCTDMGEAEQLTALPISHEVPETCGRGGQYQWQRQTSEGAPA